MCSQLRTLGHEALACAHDWESALARLKVESIDIVFLDVEAASGAGLRLSRPSVPMPSCILCLSY